MTALSIFSPYSAVGANLEFFVTGVGGVSPYTYSIMPGGAGGSINASTGLYSSPSIVPANPANCYDVIQVTDTTSATATFSILVGYPLLLICDILQNQLGLDNNHIYIWDQKIFEPIDNLPYIVLGVAYSKPFGNTNYFSANANQNQSVNMCDIISVDVFSRGNAAAFVTCPQVLMALNSEYAEQQQELNSFFIGKLPLSFLNLSKVDGAAIPYRWRLEFNLQYFVPLVQLSEYFDQFTIPPQVIINE